jgi:hypothetical protein
MKAYSLLVCIALCGNILLAQQSPKPEDTEVWEPQPEVVTPGRQGSAPSDAIVLFDGNDLDQWRKPQFVKEKATINEIKETIEQLDPNYAHPPADWTVEAGQFIVKPGTGAIESKEAFGDCQLHIEWLSPEDPGKEGQGYSNSGVFLMGIYEIQVLNNYKNKTYANGQAASVYKQHIPLVNASRPPGEWQQYDIMFTAPRFKEDGSLESPAYVTVIHNGVLVQHHVELQGPTAYIGEAYYVADPPMMPLRLQDHSDKVRYRNIWIRRL